MSLTWRLKIKFVSLILLYDIWTAKKGQAPLLLADVVFCMQMLKINIIIIFKNKSNQALIL